MNTELRIKITLIKRGYKSSLYATRDEFCSWIVGCPISKEIVDYVITRDIQEVLRDIMNELPIAIELDNLTPIWS